MTKDLSQTSVVQLLKQGAHDARKARERAEQRARAIDARTAPLMEAITLAREWITRHNDALKGAITIQVKTDDNKCHSLRLYILGANSCTLYNGNAVLDPNAFETTTIRDALGSRSSVNIDYTIVEIGHALTQYALEHDLPLPEFG